MPSVLVVDWWIGVVVMRPLTGDDPVEVGGLRLSMRLGAGGMGRVYLAFTPGGRPVALKVVRPELSDDDAFRVRFRQEVEAARRVHGLYTAQVLDADPDSTPPWLMTAYVPGPSLQESVAAHGPMPAGTVFLVMAGVAEALEAIHSVGVVHRDLKPSNVLLAPDGPRVIDFGIARALEATAVTRSGMRVGSPQFMAPEQVTGQPVSAAIDVFALGSLAAFAATGRPPFGEGNEAAVMYRVVHEPADLTGCPAELRALIEPCLAKDPADRPSPIEITRSCQAQTAGLTLAIAQAWLPPAVAAVLAEHAAPVATAATATVGVTPPPGAVRRLLRRPVSRAVGFIGAATVLALATAIGVSAALLPGNRPAAPNRQAADTSRRESTSPHGHRHGLPRRTRPESQAACVIGTWVGTSTDMTGTISNDSVLYTGRGPIETYGSDGTLTINYGKGIPFTVTVNGNKWTDVIKGLATAHYVIQNGLVLISDIIEHGTSTLLENGAYNNSSPLTLLTTPYRYTCSGNSLREFPSNGSAEYTRRVPAKSRGGSLGS